MSAPDQLVKRNVLRRSGVLIITVAVALTATSLVAGVLVLSTTASSKTENQSITATGTLAQEILNPQCYPACLRPSSTAPIMVTETVIYILTSDDPAVKQQLISYSGLTAKVSGSLQSFNASETYPGYTCSPYPCERLTSQISVTSFQIVIRPTVTTTTETTPTITTVTTSAQIPGFPSEGIITGLIIGAISSIIIRKSLKKHL